MASLLYIINSDLSGNLLKMNSKHAMQGQGKTSPCETFKKIPAHHFPPGKTLGGAKRS